MSGRIRTTIPFRDQMRAANFRQTDLRIRQGRINESGSAGLKLLGYTSAVGVGGAAGLAAFQLGVDPYARENYADNPGLYGIAIPFAASSVILGIPAAIALKVILNLVGSKSEKQITDQSIIDPVSSKQIIAEQPTYHLGTSDLVIQNGHTAGRADELRSRIINLEAVIVNKIGKVFNGAEFEAKLQSSGRRGEVKGYTVLDKIGEGGMGALYLVSREGRYFTLKLPQNNDQATIDRFLQEARSLAMIRHDNVMRIFEFIDNPVSYVGELIRGITLGELVKSVKVKLTPPEAMVIIMRVLSALQAVHDKGIIHRDIKPGNVMLTDSGILKLIDFGLAKDLKSGSELTEAGVAMGTYNYMAPEHFAFGSRSVDHRVDIYSAGILLSYLLLRRPLFEFKDQKEVFQFANDKQRIVIPPLPGIHESVRKFLEKMVAKNPDDRFQTCAEALKEANHVMLEII